MAKVKIKVTLPVTCIFLVDAEDEELTPKEMLIRQQDLAYEVRKAVHNEISSNLESVKDWGYTHGIGMELQEVVIH
ncbi:hypothetical protein [Anaeroselena agilis]|uniref:Uncharacterized protein n=1 Tax=Anaeroselena agilis TaxID=3063788 RepID=A0ABU3NVR3_9FIRM|nr:hypothetical protein [Selenomonadales bacterium 4137-cl]